MVVIRRFEDLVACREARKLSKAIRALCREGSLARDDVLCDQLRRASTSTMTSIAEGFDNESRAAGRIQPLPRHRSAVEVQSLSCIALDDNLISESDFQQHYTMAGRTKSIINSLKRLLDTGTKRVSEESSIYDATDTTALGDIDTDDTPDTFRYQ